jgi:hypothetical protein
MKQSEIKFWFEDIDDIFQEYTLLPESNQSLEEQLNSITRGIIMIWFIMVILNYKDSSLFLFLSLLFITILYYIQRNMIKENYSDVMLNDKNNYNLLNQNNNQQNNNQLNNNQLNNNQTTTDYYTNCGYPTKQQKPVVCPNNYLPLDDYKYIPKGDKLKIIDPNRFRFRPETLSVPDNTFYSTNQALLGPANPKTLDMPLIVPPISAWDYWSDDYVIPSQINDQTNQELIQNGYYVTQNSRLRNPRQYDIKQYQYGMNMHQFDNVSPKYNIPQEYNIPQQYNNVYENFQDNNAYENFQNNNAYENFQDSNVNVSKNISNNISNSNNTNNISKTNIDMPINMPVNMSTNYPTNINVNNPSPNFTMTPDEKIGKTWINQNGTPGDIMTACCYNPTQLLEHNIPSNLPSGQCSSLNTFNEYNKNLFTTPLNGPPNNDSVRTQVMEPIQSNMGITFTQQFEPEKCSYSNNKNGGKTYIIEDPRLIDPYRVVEEYPILPNNSNVYDPRSVSYGTSYRTYIDTLTGQPRHYYQDIDAIRRPEMLIRSNIDDAPWAQAYGNPMKMEWTDDPHKKAQDKFLDNNLFQRSELQERYMHKVNTSVVPQLRMAPIHTRGNTMNLCKR